MAPKDVDENKWATRFGPVVQKLIRERGLDQKQLARGMGLDPATVSRLTGGVHNTTLDQLDWMARTFGMSRRAILTRLGYLEPDGRSVIDLDTLSPTARRLIMAQIREDREASD